MNPAFHARFDELAASVHGQIGQCMPEFKAFLEYAALYFEARSIGRPVVVEIGVWRNSQKRFYEQLLGAEHIGIDIDPTTGADILGDSPSAKTVDKLKERLGGRPIDLLFIDGNHSYKGAKLDYEAYENLTRHLVVLHDLLCETHRDIKVGELWRELKAQNRDYVYVLFHKPRAHEHGTCWDGQEMGIGVMVKA